MPGFEAVLFAVTQSYHGEELCHMVGTPFPMEEVERNQHLLLYTLLC